ncbi:MAG TPA: peptidoglycan DD-metalloendopeptidase family protein [Bradyrhizobium sp.]|nr:peptidoglycan DD-metalloendopeptidase family protein [Bradyrhizobium sp.]
MLPISALLYSRRVPQMAALALISFGFAGCSADMSSRLSQNPLSNPFGYQGDATGAVQAAPPAEPARQPPQYARPQASYPAISAPQSVPPADVGVSGGGRGLASYAPASQPNYAQPAPPKLETTASVTPPRSIAAVHPQVAAAHPLVATPNGARIIVGTSDTLEIIAHRYNVTPAAILAANGYKGPRALSPGQQLVIPRPIATPAVAAAPAVPAAPKPVAAAPAAPNVHFVNRGETLLGIAHQNHVSVAEIAKTNNIDASAPLKLGAKLAIPGKAAQAIQPAPAAAVQPIATAKVASAGVQQSARLAQAAPTAEEKEATEAPVKASEATGALPTFRWPVRGKVITSYGAKTNGKSNDGINLAVPEGTPIKAAEDGVVAYSGNELKGYGNLVLVRHSNGYVTAYAHASELLVKRGDSIKRGQVIAKSGQTGEVGSPQLHFEIRKGSTPVDPLQFLNGA